MKHPTGFVAGISSSTFLSVVLSVALLIGFPETGVTQDQDEELVIDEFVVTALKREQHIQDVAAAITAFDDSQLTDLGADSFRDFGRFVPSLSISDRGIGQNQVLIRGLGPVAGTPTTAMYVDGVSSATGLPTSGSFSTVDPNLYDVERVEILRGPQGTLYGESSVGGTILLYTKRPDASKLEGSVDLSYSATEDGGDNTVANAMFNIPLVEDRFAVRGVIQSRDMGGFIDLAVFDPIALLTGTHGPASLIEEANEEETTSYRLSIGGDISGDLSVVARYSLQDVETGIFNADSAQVISESSFYDPLAIADGSFVQLNTINRFFDYSNETISLEFDWGLGFANLVAIAGRVFVDAEQNADLTGVGAEAVLDNESTAKTLELRLVSDREMAFDWILGAYVKNGERDGQFATAATFGTDIFFLVDSDILSLYGEAYWSLTDRLTLTTGLRYFEEDLTQRDNISAGFGVATTVSESFDDVTPKIGLEYAVSDDVLAYFSYSKGFRSGQININIVNDPNFVPKADPDEAFSYELGMKSQWFDDRLTLNATVFHIDWDDVQIQGVPGNAALGFSTNGGKATIDGIETDVVIVASDELTLSLGGAYVDATTDNAINGVVGAQLPNAPEVTGNFVGTYRFPVFRRYTGLANIAYSYRGDSFQSIPNIDTASISNNSGSSSFVDMKFGIEADSWHAYLFARNVFDSDDSTFRNVNVVGDLGNFVLPGEETFRARPRTIGLNFAMHFE